MDDWRSYDFINDLNSVVGGVIYRCVKCRHAYQFVQFTSEGTITAFDLTDGVSIRNLSPTLNRAESITSAEKVNLEKYFLERDIHPTDLSLPIVEISAR